MSRIDSTNFALLKASKENKKNGFVAPINVLTLEEANEIKKAPLLQQRCFFNTRFGEKFTISCFFTFLIRVVYKPRHRLR